MYEQIYLFVPFLGMIDLNFNLIIFSAFIFWLMDLKICEYMLCIKYFIRFVCLSESDFICHEILNVKYSNMYIVQRTWCVNIRYMMNYITSRFLRIGRRCFLKCVISRINNITVSALLCLWIIKFKTQTTY